MNFGRFIFRERTREAAPCGQIIARGFMDMGDYDEVCIVSIAEGRATAYLEDRILEEPIE